jgi:hypothetical protein
MTAIRFLGSTPILYNKMDIALIVDYESNLVLSGNDESCSKARA